MRRAAAVDRNHGEIRDALRAIGATVTETHRLGDGFPDLAVFFRGRLTLLEVKDPMQLPSKRKLTPKEATFHGLHKGVAFVVETVTDAFRVIGARVSVASPPGVAWDAECRCPPDESHTPPCPEARTR